MGAETGAGLASTGLALLHHELLLFAGFWLLLGLIDDLLIDCLWLLLVARGRAQSRRLPAGFAARPLRGPLAVLVPAWQEAAVIGTTVRHALAVWPHPELRLYVGCYASDPATRLAAEQAGDGDPRLRVVTVAPAGPTTKADCLNGLYRALVADEAAGGQRVRAVVLHDAEDMVHPAELAVFDAALAEAEFVQLPVRAEPLEGSLWVAGHYLDEFAEAHTKALVVRTALGAALPAAGVGCGFNRDLLDRLARIRAAAGPAPDRTGASAGPFAPDCLTEDYEIGWRIARTGGRGRFLRLRDHAGQLVATRACFPDRFDRAVRQKTRWTLGICYQGWDRLGWSGGLVDRWMALRDRRAPMAAAVLLAAYAALGCTALLALAVSPAAARAALMPDWAGPFVLACGAGLAWRLVWRGLFVAHEYGPAEGLRAVLRAPVSNLVAIAAAHRALRVYLQSLRGRRVRWDKTGHRHHPAARGQPR
ncbi:glycosyl transferase family protein [Novosphingobium piscinae]|uniref:glycosyl transferase family protein n=1 Tax=Novosphingobium piscinae TaxID=1507448 RepID=UPI001FE46FA7|nr:glycosyl transferase family protein [Novosphingobium piscinae]